MCAVKMYSIKIFQKSKWNWWEGCLLIWFFRSCPRQKANRRTWLIPSSHCRAAGRCPPWTRTCSCSKPRLQPHSAVWENAWVSFSSTCARRPNTSPTATRRDGIQARIWHCLPLLKCVMCVSVVCQNVSSCYITYNIIVWFFSKHNLKFY